MKIPKEFDYLVGCFWDGSHAEAKTLDEWVGNAVRLLNAHQKTVVKPFIEDVLRRDLSDKELYRIWNEAGAVYGFPDVVELRRVLRAILQQLATDDGK
ncbi:MAG: hypothetical protein C0465_27125 [Ralstonia sp.]|uniref:hypothetical protein n=1 Tax=Ralstonia sp. TaxID=54061 RepID=UPI00257D78B0|nr:hypothetical protein [Ralstonia sp.]MBA4234247.1 hypothetical protein [Ralstonia sp.]